MVLSANNYYLHNGKRLKTLALLPFGMYGKLDYGYIPAAGRPFKGRTFSLVGQMKSKIQLCWECGNDVCKSSGETSKVSKIRRSIFLLRR
ncbi:Hypothetical predicted protein [Mytilus galloprovincialis]|uniref:Uncharacterized protein n=1 Tax=Mytilus galloprovincialis TaxID=29158 RepID=A0A8B6GWN2_MYTGA|nr:Hypothetical predicted protein [Mytilus galloprovincialis]